MSTIVINDVNNDNKPPEDYKDLRKSERNDLDTSEPAGEMNIFKDLILSFLAVDFIVDDLVQWEVIPPLASNTTISDMDDVIFSEPPDIAIVRTCPFSRSIIDDIGIDVTYFCGSIILFLSAVMLGFWTKPAFLMFAWLFHELGSVYTDTSTIAIAAKIFTTTITRSEWFEVVMVLARFGFYTVLRLVDQMILLMPFINEIASNKAQIFTLMAKEAKGSQITKAAPTPIWKLLIDPYIMTCAGALMISNIPLVFILKTIESFETNNFFDVQLLTYEAAFLMYMYNLLGIVTIVQLAVNFSSYIWLTTLVGLTLAGVSCSMMAFIDGDIWAELSASIVAFGVGMLRAALLSTLTCILGNRYVPYRGDVSINVDGLNLGPFGFTTVVVFMGLLTTLNALILFFLEEF